MQIEQKEVDADEKPEGLMVVTLWPLPGGRMSGKGAKRGNYAVSNADRYISVNADRYTCTNGYPNADRYAGTYGNCYPDTISNLHSYADKYANPNPGAVRHYHLLCGGHFPGG